MKKKRIYISGPISDLPIDVAKESFKQAIIKVSKVYPPSEYTYINPFDLNTGVKDPTWHDYMMTCLKSLRSCEIIYMMEKWMMSDGACVEITFARKSKIKIIYHQDL